MRSLKLIAVDPDVDRMPVWDEFKVDDADGTPPNAEHHLAPLRASS
jgi:hypothetical protein